MATRGEIIVKYNHLPEFERKMVLGGKTITREILEKIASDIEEQGPYKESLKAKVKLIAGIGNVEVSPWWMGFIEFGTVDRAARPFAGPIAERMFRTLIPKVKVLGSSL